MGSGSSKAKKAQVQAEEQAQTPVEGVYEQNGGDAEAADDARQVHMNDAYENGGTAAPPVGELTNQDGTAVETPFTEMPYEQQYEGAAEPAATPVQPKKKFSLFSCFSSPSGAEQKEPTPAQNGVVTEAQTEAGEAPDAMTAQEPVTFEEAPPTPAVVTPPKVLPSDVKPGYRPRPGYNPATGLYDKPAASTQEGLYSPMRSSSGKFDQLKLTGTLEKQASSRRKLSYGQEKGDILNTGTAEE